MRHRLKAKGRKWPWVLAAVVLIFGAVGVASGKNNTQPANLTGLPVTSTTTTTALPVLTTTTAIPTSEYNFVPNTTVESDDVLTSTARTTRNHGTPKPKPKPKPNSNSNKKGHICLPGERDGDNDGKCGE